MAIQTLSDLKALINSTIYDNTTNEISGSDVQTALINAIDTLDSAEGFINVHKANGQSTITAYGSKALARAAVPSDFHYQGIVIAYKLSTGWVIEQNLDATAGTWSDDASWVTTGPVSVSQNTSTGHTDITVGSTTTPVASVEDVQNIEHKKINDLDESFDIINGSDEVIFSASDKDVKAKRLKTIGDVTLISEDGKRITEISANTNENYSEEIKIESETNKEITSISAIISSNQNSADEAQEWKDNDEEETFARIDKNGVSAKDVRLFNGDIIKREVVKNYVHNIDGVFKSVEKGKYLTKYAVCGDSKFANDLGGNIPNDVDEGVTSRPIRMNHNNFARRFYDNVSKNKPIWKRLDNSSWTLNGFAEFDTGNMWGGETDKYFRASSQGATARIIIPDGYEHFALIYRTLDGNGSFNVTINGTAPSAITHTNRILTDNDKMSVSQLEELLESNTIVNESVVPPTLPAGANTIVEDNDGVKGNQYAIAEYNCLPSGDNEIVITTTSNANVEVWGCFYWSGNTTIVINMARGGHTTADLIGFYREQLFGKDYDGIVFEIPETNNLRLSLEQTSTDVKYIMNHLDSYDVLYTTSDPIGLSIVYDTNFATYAPNDITHREVTAVVRNLILSNNKPLIDLFSIYEEIVIRRGGTIEGGEYGLWYTWDGQHPNPEGVTLTTNIILKTLNI